MRRDNRKQNKVNSNMTVLITGGILLLAIATFVITFIVYSNKLGNDLYSFDSEYLSQYTNIEENNENKQTTSASSSIGKTVEESKEETKKEINKTITNESTIKLSTNSKTTTNKISNITTSTKNKIEKDPIFAKPIEGEILKEYAKESLIYSETLKEWITHLGIDIKAERASVVKSAADGTVKDIKNDPRFGLSIIIEHSNGFETRYCNLLTTEFVSEGEEVKVGQTIGTVGDSAIYEIVDESHLHFEVLKNNESLNPCEYINF